MTCQQGAPPTLTILTLVLHLVGFAGFFLGGVRFFRKVLPHVYYIAKWKVKGAEEEKI